VISEIVGAKTRREKTRGMNIVKSSNIKWFPMLWELGCLDQYPGRHGGYHRKVRVPPCISHSPKSVVKEFISALFECDGHAYRDAPRVAFFSCYPEFTRDVQLLLLGFGVNSRSSSHIRTHKDSTKFKRREYTGRELRINASASVQFYKEIGFIGHRKRTTACVRDSKWKFRSDAFRNLMQDEVKSVVPAGRERVYDLVVPGASCFGANGILVHNSTPEDAFQLFGYEVFPAAAVGWVNQTVRSQPLAIGNLDSAGRLHAIKDRKTGACYQSNCLENHEFSIEQPLRIWELPQARARYALGGDVSEGIEQDYSVLWINKIGSPPMPDVHVATYRSNTVAPWFLADVANLLGRWYNTALVAIEYNTYQTCADRLRHFHQYPNIFRWKHPDAEKILSTRFHWVTRVNTKQWLIDTGIGWLQQHAWEVRDPVFAHEMKYFHREDFSSKKAGAASGEHDDCILAGLICLYCSHDTDIRDFNSPMVLPVESGLAPWKPWRMKCLRCDREFDADNPKQVEKCPNCMSIMLSGHKNEAPLEGLDPEEFSRLPPIKQMVAADTPYTEF
jgi:DNA-directed RNA polymerase subunit RPC12/RpoP